MRFISICILMAASALAADPGAPIREASTTWRNAVIRQDAAALKKYLADDLLYSHASGKTQTKAEYIEAVTKPPSHYESFTDSDTNIKVYGKTAVLAGIVDVKLVGQAPYRVRTLEVYVLNGGVWQMTSHQSSRIKRD